MGGYDSGSASKDDRDEDDEEEYEDVSGGNRLLGFMFGNVDYAGDLDVDYLDEDAKEHLAAVADKLGPSLTDIDLSVTSPQPPVDAVEQDYDEKAEDAVDYEDIDEQYEGPEIQIASEEDYLLPKKEYFAAEVSLAALKPTASPFDDENYDEDEELEKEHEEVDKETEDTTTILSGEQVECATAVPDGEKSPEGDPQVGSLGAEEEMTAGVKDYDEELADILKGPLDGQVSTPLPVLCVEDGKVILRFSEIFGIHEPLKKGKKRDQRYSTPKDKYNTMDVSSLVEEDEEVYLKGSGQGFPLFKEANIFKHDIFSLNDDDSELVKFGVEQDAATISEHDEQRKDSCICSEPMKEESNVNPSVGWKSIPSPNFFPLDQHDWEENIVWDNSPAASDNSIESHEIPGADVESALMRGIELDTGQNNFHERSTSPNENDCIVNMQNSPVLSETFGSKSSSDNTSHLFTESRYHPQLLRLESQLDLDNHSHANGIKENVSIKLCQSDAVKRFSKRSLQNRDMMEGSWLDNIIWEPVDAVGKPKLILDLQDEQMLFEILDNKDDEHPLLHAGAMIITRSAKPSGGDITEPPGQKYHSDWKFNIANDKFYMNGKISQQLQSNSNKRTAHGIRVHHSAPALKLQTMKLKLSNKDIANFHRPKALWYPHDSEMAVKEQGKLPTQGPMKVIVKSLGGKGSKLHVDAEETVYSIKAKALKKLDFKPAESVKLFYLGKELEDHKSLADQNVRPNSLIHLVRTKIHLLPRAQKLPGENKSLRPPGAFKKKSDLSVKDGHVFLMEYCEERPLLLSNVGMGANLCTYYQKSSPGDQAGALLCGGNNCLGNVLTLEPGDKSPFLGDIKAGCSQSSLETNMYGAPVFPHKVATTDFLLVRSAKGKISIRRIDKVAVVGQQDRENIERLEITGVGDPSGRGLGFSYVRAAPKASVSSAMVKKKVAANRGGSTVTGTDADLRRLSMEAAREVLLKFNVPEEMIAKQTRWHRIAMIRKLSSEQAASAVQVDPTTISKYARGQRMPFLQLQQQTRGKCQEIWDRQVQSLSAADDDEIGSDSEHSDLDSFAGDLENLLDAEEFEEEESNYDTKHDKVEGVKGLKMRRCPIQVQAEEEIEDDAAEVAELCRLLMDDDEAKLKKKKKKTKAPVEGGLSLAQSISGLEIVERLKKANKPAKHIAITVQPNGSHAANEQIKDPKEEESLIAKRNLSGTVQAMKKNGISPVGKKVKIVMFKEKKSSRGTFVCGACGQHGHMRTNKNCPRYRAEPETQLETADMDKSLGKSNSLDPSSQSQPKSLKKKKLISKSATKIALIEAPEDEKSSLKTKVVPVKFKCSSADKLPDKFPVASTQSSDQPSTSDVVETANKSVGKVNRIVISNKPRPEETQVESHKPSIVIRPPVDTVDKSQAESHKPSIIIRPPANTDREQVESHKPSILIRPVTTTDRELVEYHKPSIVIRPPADKDREPPQKKIIIKRPKEIIDLDRVSQDGSPQEYRKTKKIVELSNFEKREKQIPLLTNDSAKRKVRDERNWWEEEEKRRNAERIKEERARRIYEEERRFVEERERFAELRRYEESIRKEREEELLQKAKKKKKKKKPEIGDDYLQDYRAKRNDRRMPERDRGAKRKPGAELGKHSADYGPPTKRRRGGEVGLSNILERIVETLRENTELSYLFLKPVAKKEAPDYLDIIERPMDLSTIRGKVRRMEYKDREDFRHDVWQIAFNAHKYNDGRHPAIPPLADQLLELCDYLIDEYHESLSEAEAGIQSRNT